MGKTVDEWEEELLGCCRKYFGLLTVQIFLKIGTEDEAVNATSVRVPSKTGSGWVEVAIRFFLHGVFLGTFRFVGLYKKVLYTNV